MASLCNSRPSLGLFRGVHGTPYCRTTLPRRNARVHCAIVLEKSCGAALVQGTGRVSMEDTLSIVLDPSGSEPSFFGVFDGHGGDAVAEMLKTTLWPQYKKNLSGATDLAKATTKAYFEVDKISLAQPKGFLGALKERGLGGSRCGATAATVVLMPPEDGKQILIAANVGDARAVLSRGGCALQLTVDHKPDVEAERQRIEAKNPTPKKPLVVNVGGTWRIGGLLSLSRAFGDAYLKDWSDGTLQGAQGGFGLTAEPDITIQDVSPDDKVIILATDGLWEQVENQEAVDMCLKTNASPQDIANKLVKTAQDRGSTDDIAVIVTFL